jgi:Cys-rich protein (TIGR01571 family)
MAAIGENTARIAPAPVAFPDAPTQQSGGTNTNINFQPVMNQQTNVVVNVAPTRIGQRQNERGWHTGLFGCFEDFGSCLYAYCLYPCFLCSVASKMNEFTCGPCCCTCGLTVGGICGVSTFPNPFLVGMRSRLRGQYGITGSVCGDTMTVWCCECCAAMQMYRELNYCHNQ